MSCFGGRVSRDLYQNCCNSGVLCEFDGDLSNVISEPIYVQKVYDAVLVHLQGMKTVQNQSFSPAIPCGHRVKRVIDIRCRRSFNPNNVDDPTNLRLEVDTSISGASFLRNANGDELSVVGADGSFSEKLLYAETSNCDDQCMGTPIFGTQNITITGNVVIELDLLLCDSCGNDTVFTICADVNVADASQPLVLTNFFEICMPSTADSAFLPRFTELCNSACEARLATNNYGRDLCVSADGTVTGNLIIALCVSAEKKVIVPVQLCVLSTGFVSPEAQQNAICTTFPSLFPNRIRPADTLANCGDDCDESDCCCDSSQPEQTPCCESYPAPCCDPCEYRDDDCCDERRRRPQPRR